MTLQPTVGTNGMDSNGTKVVAIGSTAIGTIPSPVNNCTSMATGTTSGHQECWICYDSDRSDAGPLIQPCSCKGDMSSVHHDCLKQWLMESTTTPGRTTSNPLINPDALVGNNGTSGHGQSNRTSFKQGGINHPIAAIKCNVCNEPYTFERSGTVWLPAGLTTKGWLKTGTILSIMCLTAAAFWFTVNSSDHFYVRVIGVGLTILVEYICLRFLGFNMLIAYNRAKVAAYRITGRNWNPSSGRSGNSGQSRNGNSGQSRNGNSGQSRNGNSGQSRNGNSGQSRNGNSGQSVSRSCPSVPSGRIVKSREEMAASLGHLASDTSTIRSSDQRRSVGSILVPVDPSPSSHLNGYSSHLNGHSSHPFVFDDEGRCDEELLLNPCVGALRPISHQFRPSRISVSPIGSNHLYRSVNDVSITMAPLPSVSSSNMSRSVDHFSGHFSGHFSEA